MKTIRLIGGPFDMQLRSFPDDHLPPEIMFPYMEPRMLSAVEPDEPLPIKTLRYKRIATVPDYCAYFFCGFSR